ncbi:hypothetical protein E5D57_007879 [Metarhizium anisopliae]|nr:hypothetical protein E5D57_007879 [Metarhizium anisopliae]
MALYSQQEVVRNPTDEHLRDLSKEELQSCISAHMADYHYDASFIITSLTGSLLWALKRAHGLLSHGYREVQLILVNSWAIPEDRICPAAFLVEPAEVAHLAKRVRDAMDHEYFVFGDIPSDAILGSLDISIQFVQGTEINTLLPGFGHDYGFLTHPTNHKYTIQAVSPQQVKSCL